MLPLSSTCRLQSRAGEPRPESVQPWQAFAQAVSQKGNGNVRFNPMFPLMEDRPQGQIIFEIFDEQGADHSMVPSRLPPDFHQT